jgi:hypothetical protein
MHTDADLNGTAKDLAIPEQHVAIVILRRLRNDLAATQGQHLMSHNNIKALRDLRERVGENVGGYRSRRT